jgi:hypothetical protein
MSHHVAVPLPDSPRSPIRRGRARTRAASGQRSGPTRFVTATCDCDTLDMRRRRMPGSMPAPSSSRPTTPAASTTQASAPRPRAGSDVYKVLWRTAFRGSFKEATASSGDGKGVEWRRGWDSNPITSCRFCNLQKPRCRDCHECHLCRGALHLIAPADLSQRVPSWRDDRGA